MHSHYLASTKEAVKDRAVNHVCQKYLLSSFFSHKGYWPILFKVVCYRRRVLYCIESSQLTERSFSSQNMGMIYPAISRFFIILKGSLPFCFSFFESLVLLELCQSVDWFWAMPFHPLWVFFCLQRVSGLWQKMHRQLDARIICA